MNRFLDPGLDELAARARQGFGFRMLVTVGVAVLVSSMLPWRLSLAWLGLQSLNEAVALYATGRQALGLPVTLRRRALHLSTLACGCLIWIWLGAMLWTVGTPAGAVCGAMLWLAVIFFTQTNAYQSPTGVVIGGAIPSAAMLAFVLLGPNPLHLPMLPVGGVLILSLVFAADGVFRALAARRRFAEAQARHAASEAQYRVLADNITDVITLNRMDGERVYMSPSVSRALGYTPDELFSTNYDILHPEDATWLPDRVAALKAEGGEATLQYRLIHKDGRPVWVEANFGLIRPDGAEPMLLSVTRVIDARKALETELVDARRKAEDAAAAKSDFLANMTHELRTPLNAIIGFSGVLRTSDRLTGDDVRHVELIHAASATLLELVNSVLDFSKLEAGAVTLEARPFDPAAEARSVAGLLAEQASGKGLALSVRTEGEVRPLTGDSARLRHVMLNFLSNALKFTQRGGVTVTVHQAPAGPDADRLRIEVADTGIGLAPEQVDHLFDRFTQADASVSREYGGTGLGLAICKRNLDLMGGLIGAESRVGEGATFWFELVLPRAEALIEEVEPAAPEALERPMRLLLVEDVAVNRELILTLLRPFEIEIETAENGAQAVEAMQAAAYDLVLMDVQMPVMDGLSATRAIRGLGGGGRTTPIVAMTANVLPEQVAKCLAAGMDDHLGKPISPADLLAAISRWSGGREAAAETEVA